MPEFAPVHAVEARTNLDPVVEMRHVSAHAPDGTTLLDDVSLTVARGQVLAVVGPTGAGKTSLARVLTGSLAAHTGTMQVDGRVAFVPQDDALHGGLSLVKALDHAAALRLSDLSRAERDVHVNAVLNELGLAPHAHTMVGNLSGGQRKRASIAAQLLGDPDVLVLDEPTEGLDPGYEKVVLQTLRGLAESGRTIVVVTHSLEALRASDRVVFLAAGGSVAFFGTPKQATTYFNRRDIADVFLALDAAPELWREKFRRSRLSRVSVLSTEEDLQQTAPKVDGPTARGQLSMLLRRFVDLLRGDRRHLVLMALQAPVVGALLWAVLPANALVPESDGEFSSKAGIVILFIVLSATWIGVSNAIREVVRERAIVQWEAASGLSPRAYITSKFLALGSLVTAQSVLIGFLATARQHANDRYELIAIAALAGLAATALGLALSSLAASSDRATALLPVTLVMQLVLAGEWAANANVPLLHDARWLVGTRWAMEGMVGILNGATGQLVHAVISLGVLTALGVIAATKLVARTVRPAIAPGPRRSYRRPLTVAASAVAVSLTVGAGGTGVFAILGGSSAVVVASAPAPKHTTPSTPTTVAASAPVTTPPPVTAPPVTTPPVKRTVTTAPPTTVPELVASQPDIVTPTPAPSTPELVPTTPEVTPTNATPKPTSSMTNLMRLFNPFAPKVNR
jgi:ABC-type multidrug transport system ATPase subunit